MARNGYRGKYYRMSRIRQSRLVAAIAHGDQKRKEHNVPAIVHTEGTAEELGMSGAPEDLIVAGHLHDTIEDTPLTLREIRKKFGPKVASLVKAVTEPMGKSWEVRKRHKIRALRRGSLDVKVLGAADHCDNLWSIEQALHEEGLTRQSDFPQANVWLNFSKGYEEQKWYHQEACKAIFVNVPYDELHPLFGKLMRLVERIFGEKIIFDPKIRRKVRRRNRDKQNSQRAPVKRSKSK